jgi:hypothetical protein
MSFRNREDLDKLMMMQTPTETPFQNMMGRDTTNSRTPEWALETVRASNHNNKAIDGDDVSNDAQTVPVVVKNHVQIFDEVIGVSDLSAQIATIDGRKELARQLLNAGKALRLDMEKRFSGNYASVAATTSVAGETAGAQAWITTNISLGASGANGGGYNSGTGLVPVHTAGTNRSFTATIFKSSIQSAWTAGKGTLADVLVGPAQKVNISAFTGVVQATNEVSKTDVTILGAVDVYKSDFGFHRIQASREMDANSCLILTKETWKVATLDPYNIQDLAKTGHSTRKLLRTAVTLKCMDEKRNALIMALS